jgi:predicted dehydrogenase
VGHTERFNPAVIAARPAVDNPGFIEVHRLGTFPERSLDIDVVFDLMIHDLDLVLSIVQSEIESIEAVGVPVLTDRFDIANARLRFASGCVANITASRISRDRTRKIRFFQRDAYISIDTGARKAESAVSSQVRQPPARHRGRESGAEGETASQRAPGLRGRGQVRARAARRRL